MRFYDRSVMDQLSKAKEYHFLNMHVYVNPLFRNDKELNDKYIYHHYDPIPTHFSKDHHVHIYLWKFNTDIENILGMFKFIGEINKIVRRPVYIHMPKRVMKDNPDFVSDFKALLDGIAYDGNYLRYEMIVERTEHVTDFKYGDYIPIPGVRWGSKFFPEASLTVGWDWRGYAIPTFYSKKKQISESGFE